MMNHSEIIQFYQAQLKKFMDLQDRGQVCTEFGVRVTPVLIEATQRRLSELRAIRDRKWIAKVIKDSEQNGEVHGRV